MPCRSHEIFYPYCGHLFRCEEPATDILPLYSHDDPRRSIKPHQPHQPHDSLNAHPCNKHLPRTISSADRSPVGSWQLCSLCQGGPKLPDHFKLQKFSMGEEYWEWDWEKESKEVREYYAREFQREARVEWACENSFGREWDLVKGGLYEWERQAGLKKSCRERTAEQQLRENPL